MKGNMRFCLVGVIPICVFFGVLAQPCVAEWYDTYDFEAEQVLGYWPFDGSLEDISGQAEDGLPNNPASYVPGAMGQGLVASGNRVLMGDVCPVTDTLTISAWTWSNATGGSQTLIRRGGPVKSTVPYSIGFEDGGALAFHNGLLGPANLNSVAEPPPGEWYHVALTFDGLTRKVYYNGELDNSDTPAGSIFQGPGIFGIGFDPENVFHSTWNGNVDDLIVFGRSLSGDEVGLLARDLNENGVADFWEDEFIPTSTPTPIPTPPPIPCGLLAEDFSDGVADDWDPQGGNWQIVEGAYRRADAKPHLPEHTVYRGLLSSAWSDYSFACDFQVVSQKTEAKEAVEQSEIEFLFRYVNENNYYKLTFYHTPGKTAGATYKLRKKVGGTWIYLTSHVPVFLDPSIVNRVEIRAVGDTIALFLNETELQTVSDHSLCEGTIGLNSVCRAVDFDNICVTALSHADPTPTPTPEAMACDLLFEDFMDGIADDWNPQAGAWEVVDGFYRRGDAKPHLPTFAVYSRYGATEWTNYNYGCDFRRYACCAEKEGTETIEVDFIFRYVDNDNYYKLTFTTPPYKCTDSSFKLRKRLQGDWFDLTSNIPVSLDIGVLNHLDIKARGRSLSVYLNGRRLFKGADSSHPAGSIGLNSSRMMIGFTNVCVTSLEPLPTLSKPRNLRATPGADNILVEWDPNPEENLAGYNVYRAVSEEGEFIRLNDQPVRVPHYLDEGLAVGDRYCYKVTAVDTMERESEPAGPVCAIVGQLIAWTPDVFGGPGEIVRIPVNISNAQGIIDNGVNIELDARTCVANDMIQYVSWERTGLTSHFIYDSFEPFPGDVRLTTVSTSGFGLTGGGHIVDLYFQVPETAQKGTCCTFGFNQQSLGVRLYTMEEGLPVALDVDYSDTSRFCVSYQGEYKLGDIFPLCHDNGPDGVVDAGDVLMALAISVGRVDPATCPHILDAGDINGDGAIDAADVILITRLSVGMPINPPDTGKSVDSYDDLLKDAPPEYWVSVGQIGLTEEMDAELAITIDDAAGIAGADIQVNFDQVVAELLSVTPGSLAGDFQVESNIDKAAEGVLKFSIARASNLPSGGGTLALLRFRAGHNAGNGTSTPVVLADVKLSRQHGEDVSWTSPVYTVNGRVTVCPPYDIDGSGSTDANDLMLFGRQWMNPFLPENLLDFMRETE